MKEHENEIASPPGSNVVQNDITENKNTSVKNKDIEKTLGLGKSGKRKKKWQWIFALMILLIVTGFLVYWFMFRTSAPVQYNTAIVERGNLTVNVTATGNLEPVNTVDVGSELSGLIKTVNVDVNDRVQTGQILAVLDTKRLEAEVVQAQASVASSKAALEQADATLQEQQLQSNRMQQLYT
ncbi:MAG TPA: biotin/lipoyl-binding protein, partial [Balneolales bacterium]|nr:biotin/lipoyl-binding protein [Balneolales bacterium]